MQTLTTKQAHYKTAQILRSPALGDRFEPGEYVGVEYAGKAHNATVGHDEDTYRIFTGNRQAYVFASYLHGFFL